MLTSKQIFVGCAIAACTERSDALSSSTEIQVYHLSRCRSKRKAPTLIIYRWFLVILLTIGLWGCQRTQLDRSTPTATKDTVVVTNAILCDLTNQIAAGTIDLVCLLPPGSDPHTSKLTPADRKAITTAKLLMYGGYNLEPDLEKAIATSNNPAPKIAINEIAVPSPQKFTEDGQSTIDPHVWHDAKNGVKIANVIATNLAKVMPQRSSIYRANAKKLGTGIARIDTWIRSQIATIPADRRILVTTHDALGYYAQAYGIQLATLEGVSPEEKPNAAIAKTLVDLVVKTKVPTIYAEVSLNPKLINSIARSADVKLSSRSLYSDTLGEPGSTGDSYQKMLVANTQAIVEGLGGKYTPWQISR